jgi:hypothetical protein
MGGRSATRPRIELWLISTNQGEVGKTFHFPLRGRVAHRPPNTVEILTIFNRKFTAQDNFDFLTRYIGSVLISYICGWSVCHTTTETEVKSFTNQGEDLGGGSPQPQLK